MEIKNKTFSSFSYVFNKYSPQFQHEIETFWNGISSLKNNKFIDIRLWEVDYGCSHIGILYDNFEHNILHINVNTFFNVAVENDCAVI